MNTQEIFDTVVKHVLSMNERSMNVGPFGETCSYRGRNGAKCAVGILIPDETYIPEMEFKNFDIEFITTFKNNLPDYMIANLNLLQDLQRIHDNRSHWDFADKIEMKIAFANIANIYNLHTNNVIDENELKPYKNIINALRPYWR